jgi:hypothetical protein
MRVACSIARTSAAFVFAPLVVPALWVAYMAFEMYGNNSPYPPPLLLLYSATAVISAIVAYSGTVVFGVPIYLWLRIKRRTGFALAPLAGFGAGVVAMLLLLVWTEATTHITMLVPAPGRPPGSTELVQSSWSWAGALEALVEGGLSGAVVAVVLWLIDRPDRRGQGCRTRDIVA